MGCKFTTTENFESTYNVNRQKPQKGQWVLTPYGIGEVMEVRRSDGMYGVRLGSPGNQFGVGYMLADSLSSAGAYENVAKIGQWCLSSSGIGLIKSWRVHDKMYEVDMGMKDNSFGTGFIHESSIDAFGDFDDVRTFKIEKKMTTAEHSSQTPMKQLSENGLKYPQSPETIKADSTPSTPNHVSPFKGDIANDLSPEKGRKNAGKRSNRKKAQNKTLNPNANAFEPPTRNYQYQRKYQPVKSLETDNQYSKTEETYSEVQTKQQQVVRASGGKKKRNNKSRRRK